METQEMEVQNQMPTSSWSPKQVMEQVNAIQALMKMGMSQDEHYGIIPGTNSKKPTLLKPGAEKLCLMFRLATKFEIIDKEMPNGHKEIQVRCSLTNIPTGQFWGEGVGSCSTMESKYRYRTGVGPSTGVQVPKDYWDKRRVDPKAAQEIIGKGYTTKKGDDGLWWIHEKIDKTENPDIADVYNTVLKMAKKRALVDATLTATAASDIFTQDLEELLPDKPEEIKKVVPPVNEAIAAQEAIVMESQDPQPPKKTVLKKSAPESVISHDEQLELIRMVAIKNVPRERYLGHLKEKYGINGTAQVKSKDYDNIYSWIIQNEQDGVEA